jgi:hypothetical protein
VYPDTQACALGAGPEEGRDVAWLGAGAALVPRRPSVGDVIGTGGGQPGEGGM